MVTIYGHIHQGFIQEKEGYVFANPGSISLPKCNSEHSYIIIEEDKIKNKNDSFYIIIFVYLSKLFIAMV